jgi:hypothetical protein
MQTKGSDQQRGGGLSIKRRIVLLALPAAFVGGVKLAWATQPDVLARRHGLNALLDEILPEDDVSPAASRLGIGEEVLGLCAEYPLMEQLIVILTDWFEKAFGKKIETLDPEIRIQAVALLAAVPQTELQGRLYSVLRSLAIELYYSKPEALAGFNLNAAPQPDGYPPPWL